MRKQTKCKKCPNPIARGNRSGLCSSCYSRLRKQHLATESGRPTASDIVRLADRVEARLQPTVKATNWQQGAPRLEGSRFALLNDVHIPFHSVPVLKNLVMTAQLHGVDRLVVCGDFAHFDGLSHHPSDGPNGDAFDDLMRALDTLGILLDCFSEIHVAGGNHDVVRFTKTMDAAQKKQSGEERRIQKIEKIARLEMSYEDRYRLMMQERAEERLGELADRIFWYPHTHADLIMPDGERWHYTHQKAYSRKATLEADNIHLREQCNVITTHSHVWGVRVAANGKHVLANLGCASPREFSRYANRHDPGLPEWVLGHGLLVDGVLMPFPLNPRLVDWKGIERRYREMAG